MKKSMQRIIAGVLTLSSCVAVAFAVFPANSITQPAEDKNTLYLKPLESNNVQLMSVDIPVEDYTEYGISALAEDAKLVTASLMPAAATSEIEWTVEWKDPTSTLVSGKNVTDYVVVEPLVDGGREATVSCMSAFGEQIILKATTRDNNVSASATVDYELRFLYASFTLDANTEANNVNISDVVGNGTDIEVAAPNYIGNCGKFELSVNPVYSAHTVATDSYVVNYKGATLYVKCSTEFAEQLSSVGLSATTEFVNLSTSSLGFEQETISSGSQSSIVKSRFNTSFKDPMYVGKFYNTLCNGITNSSGSTFNSSLTDFLAAARNVSGHHFEIKAVCYPYKTETAEDNAYYIDESRTVETTYKVTFSAASMRALPATNITLDTSAIVF